MPSLTAVAKRSRCTLQGVTSLARLATATKGFCQVVRSQAHRHQHGAGRRPIGAFGNIPTAMLQQGSGAAENSSQNDLLVGSTDREPEIHFVVITLPAKTHRLELMPMIIDWAPPGGKRSRRAAGCYSSTTICSSLVGWHSASNAPLDTFQRDEVGGRQHMVDRHLSASHQLQRDAPVLGSRAER